MSNEVIIAVVVCTIGFIVGFLVSRHNYKTDVQSDVEALISKLSEYTIISTQEDKEGNLVKLVFFFDDKTFEGERGNEVRDPNRIDNFCEELKALWKKYPDFRFWQMIINVASTFDIDPFYVEDDKALEVFKKYFETHIVVPSDEEKK